MTTIGDGGNYVSDSALLAWVTVQQNRQYGELQGAMDFETMRGEMMGDLAQIKAHAQDATKNTDGMAALDEEIAAFQAKYGAVPEFKGVVDSVAGLGGAAHGQAAAAANYAEAKAAYDAQPTPQGDEPDTRGPVPQPAAALDNEQVKQWISGMDDASDASNQNEQLGMIHINEIKSTIDHGAELASQLIKSSNDTTNFTINNFT